MTRLNSMVGESERMNSVSRSTTILAIGIVAANVGVYRRDEVQFGASPAPAERRARRDFGDAQTSTQRRGRTLHDRNDSASRAGRAHRRLGAVHGARQDVRVLCERIVVAQRDEIALMQTWLRDRAIAVPDAKATHMKMTMHGMEMDMLMPGMLTDEQLAQLDKARGAEFDRLFLQAMIGHHQGAITMVDELLERRGCRAGRRPVYRFASDVYADQTTEIERMQKMLAAGQRGPLSRRSRLSHESSFADTSTESTT